MLERLDAGHFFVAFCIKVAKKISVPREYDRHRDKKHGCFFLRKMLVIHFHQISRNSQLKVAVLKLQCASFALRLCCAMLRFAWTESIKPTCNNKKKFPIESCSSHLQKENASDPLSPDKKELPIESGSFEVAMHIACASLVLRYVALSLSLCFALQKCVLERLDAGQFFVGYCIKVAKKNLSAQSVS